MSVSWWDTESWHEYERAYGDEPGTRSELLATAPWSTRVVDLSGSRDLLWSGVRRSYHSIINGLGREFLFQQRSVAVGASGAREAARRAQTLHAIAAGRPTRSTATWDVLAGWTKTEDSHGLWVLGADPRDNDVGYAFFVIHEGWAYYFSAASLRRDLGLALIWWGMLALREYGVRWCELGWQGELQRHETFRDDEAFKKRRNIEFVRRGFGGLDVPVRLSGRSPTGDEYGGQHGRT